MPTTFKVNDNTKIVCTSNKTKNGFCHRATLYVNDRKQTSSVVSYLNRTWERYDYETVLGNLLRKTNIVKGDTKEATATKINELLRAWGSDPNLNGMGALKSIGMAAMLGDIFGKDKKESNDWKKRMLNAGLGDYGLSMPEDWDQLSEDEKERRLNGAIEIIK